MSTRKKRSTSKGGGAIGTRHSTDEKVVAAARQKRPQLMLEAHAPFVSGNLELRPSEYQAFADGRRINFTLREYEVLCALAAFDGNVMRRESIYLCVWGGEMEYRDRSVDVYVRKIRNKLAGISPGWVYIHTHFGLGYRFSPEPIVTATDRPTDGIGQTPDPTKSGEGASLRNF